MPAPQDPPAGPLDVSGLEPGVTSPARRARVDGWPVDEALRPWDLGSWAGRELTELPVEELVAWRADPAFDGHGGEPFTAVATRTAGWLAALPEGRTTAVTHAAVVRCAVLQALSAPLSAAWDLDLRPGSRTVLHRDGQRWRVRSVGALL